MKKILFILGGWLVAIGGYAQGAAPEPSEAKVPNEVGQGTTPGRSSRPDTSLLHFFAGHWTGKGEFAGGRAIEAEVDFALSLDSCWIVYEHRDRAPNSYKATSMWGSDRSGQFVAYTFDNFHGHRQWVSNGWIGGKLVLNGSSPLPSGGVMFEHFIYEKVGPAQFKMTYEVSGDGIKWQMGDWLVFTKVQ